MIHAKGFVRYTPTSPLPDDFPFENIDDPNIAYECKRHFLAEMVRDSSNTGIKPIFVRDEEGRCWYDLVDMFDDRTFKIVYCPKTGRVISFDKDASRLFPHDNNVIELEEVPDNFEADTWRINDLGELELNVSFIYRVNKDKQTALLRDAVAHIMSLQMIKDLTPFETAELAALKEYVVEVKRVDLGLHKIKWPDIPV